VRCLDLRDIGHEQKSPRTAPSPYREILNSKWTTCHPVCHLSLKILATRPARLANAVRSAVHFRPCNSSMVSQWLKSAATGSERTRARSPTETQFLVEVSNDRRHGIGHTLQSLAVHALFMFRLQRPLELPLNFGIALLQMRV